MDSQSGRIRRSGHSLTHFWEMACLTKLAVRFPGPVVDWISNCSFEFIRMSVALSSARRTIGCPAGAMIGLLLK